MAGNDNTNPQPQKDPALERTPPEAMQPNRDIEAAKDHPVRGPKEPPPDPPTKTK